MEVGGGELIVVGHGGSRWVVVVLAIVVNGCEWWQKMQTGRGGSWWGTVAYFGSCWVVLGRGLVLVGGRL